MLECEIQFGSFGLLLGWDGNEKWSRIPPSASPFAKHWCSQRAHSQGTWERRSGLSPRVSLNTSRILSFSSSTQPSLDCCKSAVPSRRLFSPHSCNHLYLPVAEDRLRSGNAPLSVKRSRQSKDDQVTTSRCRKSTTPLRNSSGFSLTTQCPLSMSSSSKRGKNRPISGNDSSAI